MSSSSKYFHLNELKRLERRWVAVQIIFDKPAAGSTSGTVPPVPLTLPDLADQQDVLQTINTHCVYGTVLLASRATYCSTGYREENQGSCFILL
jgi:hypothetical protein